jgi:hypothetical protein
VANNSQRPVAKAFCLQNNLQYGLIWSTGIASWSRQHSKALYQLI